MASSISKIICTQVRLLNCTNDIDARRLGLGVERYMSNHPFFITKVGLRLASESNNILEEQANDHHDLTPASHIKLKSRETLKETKERSSCINLSTRDYSDYYQTSPEVASTENTTPDSVKDVV